ncbi:MAG: ABC transporter substrate-binding protein [Pseudomonadota bacterium]
MKNKAYVIYLQRISIWVSVVIVLFVIADSAYSAEARGVTDDTIKIGVIYDQTGPVASLAIPITKGIRSLFQYTNEQGGIHGRKLKALVEDDRTSIPVAVAAFKKLLYRDGVLSLFGPGSTGATVALLSSINKEKIPAFPGSTSDRMVEPFQRYIFTVNDTNTGMMKVVVDYIMKDFKAKGKRIGIVYPDNEAGRAESNPALERLKFYDVEPVAKEVLNYGVIEATSQVLSLKKNKVDYIILCGQTPQGAIVFLRELKKFDVNVPVVGNWATCEEDVVRIGDAAKQFYSINAMASWYDEGPGVAKMREITLKYEPGTEKPYRAKTYTSGWVTAVIKIEALKRAGRDLDGEALVKSLESMNNFDTGGLSGPISYSPISHKGGSVWKIFKSDPSTGKFIPVTGWRTPQ